MVLSNLGVHLLSTCSSLTSVKVAATGTNRYHCFWVGVTSTKWWLDPGIFVLFWRNPSSVCSKRGIESLKIQEKHRNCLGIALVLPQYFEVPGTLFYGILGVYNTGPSITTTCCKHAEGSPSTPKKKYHPQQNPSTREGANVPLINNSCIICIPKADNEIFLSSRRPSPLTVVSCRADFYRG